MAGRDYSVAATWLVSFGVNPAEGRPAFYIWLRSTWPDRPAQALLQASATAVDPELEFHSSARDYWAPAAIRQTLVLCWRPQA